MGSRFPVLHYSSTPLLQSDCAGKIKIKAGSPDPDFYIVPQKRRIDMGKRSRARELALQVLFHLEFNPGDQSGGFDLICAHFSPPGDIRDYSQRLVQGICGKKKELDRLIGMASKHWRLERMSYVDRNILRLAVFEILFMEDVPPKVSIDEAVELGKKYGTEESGAFINGILDHIYNALLNRKDHASR